MSYLATLATVVAHAFELQRICSRAASSSSSSPPSSYAAASAAFVCAAKESAPEHLWCSAMASKVLLLAALLGVASAIYPDDHWSYSTKLTASNIDDEIKAAVDGGKTMFVRLIASAG